MQTVYNIEYSFEYRLYVGFNLLDLVCIPLIRHLFNFLYIVLTRVPTTVLNVPGRLTL